MMNPQDLVRPPLRGLPKTVHGGQGWRLSGIEDYSHNLNPFGPPDISGYLKEAKNLATYHHERWDGKGYPSGKSGVDIPLSARIMAVADVFDALVSRRSYKEPFTFEKAMSIIEEGAGTQFDPEIAKLFIESADEVREISARHETMSRGE